GSQRRRHEWVVQSGERQAKVGNEPSPVQTTAWSPACHWARLQAGEQERPVYWRRRRRKRAASNRPDPKSANDVGSGTTLMMLSQLPLGHSTRGPLFGDRIPPLLPLAFRNATLRLTALPVVSAAT